MVYVLDINGTPLMPTTRYGKVRRMLNENKAIVVRRNPFTIQLNYKPKTRYIQRVTLGVDTGCQTIGLSATYYNNKTSDDVKYVEIFNEKVDTRKDVQSLVKQRKSLRNERRRRNDKRKGKAKKVKGLNAKKKTALSVSSSVYSGEVFRRVVQAWQILPIYEIIMKVAEVPSDKQIVPMIPKATSLIKESSYLDNGKRLVKLGGLRKGVFTRDRHTCQWCQNNKQSDILFTRNIDNWFDKPKDSKERLEGYHAKMHNIDTHVTLCEKCTKKWDKLYNKYYNGGKINEKYKNKFYNIMNYINKRHREFCHDNPYRDGRTKLNLFNNMKYVQGEFRVRKDGYFGVANIDYTYGLDIANYRYYLGIKYDPINNARIMSTFPYHSGDSAKNLKPLDHYYYSKHRRRHNRSIQKITPNKNGERPFKPPEYLYGFKSYDLVKYVGDKHPEYKGKCFFITKRRSNGYFALGHADGTTVLNSVKHNLLKLVKRSSAYSTEVIKQRIEYA